ncbi:TetR/AcrR family transcriptional regulator [Szabonella alba]|uniref:TetR/AcrR family transcriptional regulator n=1 Tax=Szabonella alba TaxID=2804194 RepID=A0A8K0VBJ9_9RHOB|nr:TetR/AcrR family transcriptional regulator [Szabonella alba]MBL4916865.1 TetR/AcrR family transcriptional regulator [Szabonella alba]
MKPISEIRRPEIVQAAIRTIGRLGLPMASYDQIARETDMSRQLIRHYFPDSEVLMVAVCDALAASYRECLMQGILKANTARRLPMFLDFYFNFLAGEGLAKPADDAVYDAMFALAAGSDKLRKNLFDQYNLLHHTIAHEVQISHPTLPQSACREIGYLFVALMYGHWKMVATLGFSEDYNRVSREAVDRLIDSYVARYDDPDLRDAPDTPRRG